MASSVVIVGGGVFGLSAACELRNRGLRVELIEAGTIPAVNAASTDISKIIRMDYGTDELYVDLVDKATQGFVTWNQRWGSLYQEQPFHQDGMLVLSRAPLQSGSFEGDSFRTLRKKGFKLQLLDKQDLCERYPVWGRSCYSHAYFNPYSGWAESGRVVEMLRRDALAAGVLITEHDGMKAFSFANERCGDVNGVITSKGRVIHAERVLVCAGAYTSSLVPATRHLLRPTPQPVLHFVAPQHSDYSAELFPIWAADIAKDGWYGFPAVNGVLKVANHGDGLKLALSDATIATATNFTTSIDRLFMDFARNPLGVSAPEIVRRRVCWYSDSFDGHFLIDTVPSMPRVVVAAGGSGHAFKFAPTLGPMIADAVCGYHNPTVANRFGWRANGAVVEPPDAARSPGMLHAHL